MTKDIQHGGAGTAYAHQGCRCAECTAANTDRQHRRRLERYAETKDPNDPRHGTASFYGNHGCRCQDCTDAQVVKNKQYQERNRK